MKEELAAARTAPVVEDDHAEDVLGSLRSATDTTMEVMAVRVYECEA